MNKKAAFTSTVTMCTKKKKKTNVLVEIRFNMKERSVRARPDVVLLVKDRCRGSQQISTDQWKMRLSWTLLLLHTIETHGDTAASRETAQASLLRSNNSPKLTIYSVIDARRFLTLFPFVLCWMRQARAGEP